MGQEYGHVLFVPCSLQFFTELSSRSEVSLEGFTEGEAASALTHVVLTELNFSWLLEGGPCFPIGYWLEVILSSLLHGPLHYFTT